MKDLTIYRKSTFYRLYISENFYNEYVQAFKNKNDSVILMFLKKISNLLIKNNISNMNNLDVIVKNQDEDVRIEKTNICSSDTTLKKAME